MKRLALLLCALAMLLGYPPLCISCSPKDKVEPAKPGGSTKPDPEPEPEPEPDINAYGERVALFSAVTRVQPMTGLVLWNNSSSNREPYVQLEFSYMLYNDVCKEKDVFDWSVMDKLLADVASRGHQAVVRFRYTYPGKSCSVPDYIKAWPGYEATNAKSEGRNTEFPDWRCEELQRFHLEFHRRFAERYDTDPRLAFVETGFGLWAEYHIYDGPFVIGRTFPSKEFQSEFLPRMDEWFQHTPWLISIDASDGKYGPFTQQPELKDLNFGNFDDSFMCEDWDGYNYRSWSFFGKDRYKKAPLGGEFSYYSSYDQKHCLDAGGMYGRVFEEQVALVHMTFIIGNDQPGKQKPARLKEASMSMGYHFEIRDFRIHPGEDASVCIANTGVAPIYRDAFVAVEGVRSGYNLRELMPGQEVWVTIPCPSTYASSPSIECDHLVPGQVIEYDASIE